MVDGPDDIDESADIEAYAGIDESDDFDDEYVYLPPETSTIRKLAYVGGGLLLFLSLTVGLGGWWFMRQLNPGSPGAEVTVVIPQGASTVQIATLLEDRGVIKNSTIFQFYLKWKDAGPFRAGKYDGLRGNSAMADVVKRLDAGPLPPDYLEFRVKEGSWMSETKADILAAFPQMNEAELVQALLTVRSEYQPDGSDNLEGFLFPATYRVEEGTEADEQRLVKQMVGTFDSVGAEIGLADASTSLAGVAGDRPITPYDVVIVASMIEAEAKIPEDRAKIARVIYNRLKVGEMLGIDATVIYALGTRTEDLTKTDLALDSPYNTRLKPGMPPSPIGQPSRESLVAALNPAEGNWMYYVLADENGGHYFTDNYADFQRVERESRDKGLF